MPDLVTLHQAKHHLRLPLEPREDDDDIELKLAVAEALVLDYIKQRVDDADGYAATWNATVDAWTAATVSPIVQAAILLQLAELWRFRGDDGAGEQPPAEPGMLAPRVVALLTRFRDPAVS